MTREEVMISLGLDASALKTGMTSADFVIKESMQDTFKGIKRLVGINMVEMGMKAIELWDKASQKIGDFIYSRIYDATETAIGAARDKLRSLVKDTQDATGDLAKGRRGFIFKTGSPELQQSVLEAERGEINFKLAAAEKDKHFGELAIERAKKMVSFGKEDAATTDKYRVEAVKNVAESEIKILKLQAEQLKNEEEQKDLADKQAEAAKKQAEEEKKIFDLEKDNQKDKLEYEKYIGKYRKDADDAQERAELAQQARRSFTIAELAKADFMQGTPWQKQASDIVQLRQWAQENRMMGFFGKAEWQENRADQMTDSLRKQNSFIKEPLDDIYRTLDESLTVLEEIQEHGLPWQVTE